MRVINITWDDYANYGYHNAMAMRSVGIDAEAFCLKRHGFGYDKHATNVTMEQIVEECNKADVIQVMHSCDTMYNAVKNLDKKIIVWHTGTRYRTQPDHYNKMWNPIVYKSVLALGEFMNSGAKNPVYFGITVDVDSITPDYKLNTPLVVAHYPSNPLVKGTSIINTLTRGMNYRTGGIVPHPQNVERMQKTDIYIEMMALKQGGYPYGSFGTTAVEAAAMGKIVLTNNLWEQTYKKVYGACGLVISNNPKDMLNELKTLLSSTDKEIIKLKKRSRRWAEKHGYKKQGKRMLKLLK